MGARPSSKPGTAVCGLYLILPEDWLRPDFLHGLQDVFRAINASAHEKNNHVIELRHLPDRHDEGAMEMLRALCTLCQAQGVNFIIGEDIEMARHCEADGVMLNNMADVENARALLGEAAIIGLRCASSRMNAERALKAGADYVSFYSDNGHFVDPSVVQWWCRKTDYPCLVEGRFTNDDCAFYVRAGAYFIEASDYVWTHPQGVMQAVVNMTYAIDLAAEE